VADVDQRGINNQRSQFIDAPKAARMLDVKLQTLYAYASRGMLRSMPTGRGRGHFYALEDLRRLKARRDARRGHSAVAGSALDFGAPVLDSAITRIDRDGPHYRGASALELARAGASFETAISQLWTGDPQNLAEAAAEPGLRRAAVLAARVLPRGARPIDALSVLLAILRSGEAEPIARSSEAELPRAHALVRGLASGLQLGRAGRIGTPNPRMRIAELACRALGAELAHAPVIDSMLVLLADHELNPSTFAVRVAASTRADLYACLSAGLAALSGSSHGGYCDQIEALVGSFKRPAAAYRQVRERARVGRHVPGFGEPGVGHPLYPDADPRGAFLLARARELAPRAPAIEIMTAMAEAFAELGQPGPVSDFGLVAVCMALQLPPGAATGLFAVSRSAGWVAHVLEQRDQRVTLRPRARYVGR
jgi:citrate synthase